MIHQSIIDAQLSRLGVKRNKWCAAEIKELQHILLDDENIIACVKGRYYGGFALLVATQKRLLLIDKKMLYLGVEDIRYDMISEVNFNANFIDATINIYTVNKQHKFTSINKNYLRKLTQYLQQRVMEMRQYQEPQPSTPQPVTSNIMYQLQPIMQQPFAIQQPVQAAPQPSTQHHLLPHPHLPHPHLPRPHVSQSVGQVATVLAAPWSNPNPYTRGSLLIRRSGNR